MSQDIATLEREDYVHRVEALSRAAGRSAPPDVVFEAISKRLATRTLRRRERITIDPTRISRIDRYGLEHSQVLLARAVVLLRRRTIFSLLCVSASLAFIIAGVVRFVQDSAAQTPIATETGQGYSFTPFFIAAVFLVALELWISERDSDRRIVELVGKEAFGRWLRTSTTPAECWVRIKAVGGTPPRRRARQPIPRPRTELSWRTTLAVLAVIWTVLYANATVGAVGDLIDSTVAPDDTSTTWSAILAATRLIVSSVLAVAILVVVKNWRNLTWTQLGIPYQRWAHGKWGRTQQVKRRRAATWITFAGFLFASKFAAIISSVVGGVDAEQNLGIENLIVAVIQCIRAGIFEEIGMIAIPAALVLYRTRIDRPSGNIWPVAALVVGSGIARAVPHIYYGPGALVWAFTWGAIVMIIFLRTRRILPIIAAHIIWDLFAAAMDQF